MPPYRANPATLATPAASVHQIMPAEAPTPLVCCSWMLPPHLYSSSSTSISRSQPSQLVALPLPVSSRSEKLQAGVGTGCEGCRAGANLKWQRPRAGWKPAAGHCGRQQHRERCPPNARRGQDARSQPSPPCFLSDLTCCWSAIAGCRQTPPAQAGRPAAHGSGKSCWQPGGQQAPRRPRPAASAAPAVIDDSNCGRVGGASPLAPGVQVRAASVCVARPFAPQAA